MKISSWFVLVVEFWWNFRPTSAQSAANFVIQKFYFCEDVPNQVINITVVPKNLVSGSQIVDITISTPIPLDNQLRLSFAFYLEVVVGKMHHWQQLFAVEDDFCRIIQMYVGEVWYSMETAMGVPRGCPMAKGNYHAINHTLDFGRFKLQSFPLGKLKSVTKILKKPAKNVLMCLVGIINNV